MLDGRAVGGMRGGGGGAEGEGGGEVVSFLDCYEEGKGRVREEGGCGGAVED